MESNEIKIGTRGSPLARLQANWVKEQLLQRYPDLKITIVTIHTTGDRIQDAPLAKIGGKGVFVKEIEEALLRKEIDLAIHSVKDVPVDLPEGLQLAAISSREDPRDVLISRHGKPLANLPDGARIGTSSLRRQIQLLHHRNDLEMVPLRGNLDTRLRKLDEMGLDAIVVAYAGVRRMGFERRISGSLSPEICLPAVGQGSLGIETRANDTETAGKVAFIDDPSSSIAISGERAFLKRLGGGCQVPVAAYGRIEGDKYLIDGFVGSTDGKRFIRYKLDGEKKEAEALGTRLAEILLEMGGKDILEEVYRESSPSL